ncbi:MAG: S46 family peptidase [Planctomycetes bacterium]|nr:S46 family peptidase [Planctomycetota bacterium]
MRSPGLGLLLSLVSFAAPALAQDELGLGKMWTFERPPLAYLEREYGFKADERWWNTLRLASLRFGRGCSASFVSPQGLILTNHHCARGAVAEVQGDNDWVRDGFVADELDDEVRLPGLTVQQLVDMQDVTAEVERDVDDAMSADDAEARREQNRERILAQARARNPERTPQLVKLFQGAVWQLYEYRVFDDIRLVMAPHLQAAHFGGDPDNFVYPRYAVDFSFCRAYVDGKPADTSANFFRWGDGPEVGELVLLTGNPGGTSRLLTKAQLEYQRDARYPRVRELIDNRLAVLREFSERDPEMEKRLRTVILNLENGQKLYRGEHGALRDPNFMARKERAEEAFQQRARDSGRGEALAIWRELEKLMRDKVALDAPLNFQSTGGLPLLLRAEAVLQFGETGDEAAAQKARDVVCRRDAVQEALFVDHLERARKWLPAGDPYLTAILGDREPAAAVAALLEKSRLAEPDRLEELLRGGRPAIDECEDPAIAAMRAVRPLAQRNAARERSIAAAEAQLGARIARLLFAVYGNDVSPDATFTLRFSDGRVAGYPYNGSLAPWRTVFHGMFARNVEFDGVHPFDLPEPWLLARDRIDMQAPVDFVCTVDSTGGNSGSPVVNSKLELVGLLFDGNIESMANEFLYGERVERSVCVHPQGIVEALRKVYEAKRLLREIGR